MDLIDAYKLSNQLSKEAIDIIWNEIELNPEFKGKQPVRFASDIIKFLEKKKLPKEFYPYYEVNYYLMNILKKSSFYKDIERKYEEYTEKLESVEPDFEYSSSLQTIYQKIIEVYPKFKGYKVEFKKFGETEKDLVYPGKNKKIYFSSEKLKEKLDKEWKFWIFAKIIKTLDIKIEDSYSLLNNVLATKLYNNNNMINIMDNKNNNIMNSNINNNAMNNNNINR